MKQALLLLIIVCAQDLMAQAVNIEGFVRLPHVVNINFTEKSSVYTPVISTGVTLRYQSGFADFGIFMDKSNFYGYYTYFGSAVYVKPLDANWKLVANWFGETTFSPDQSETQQSWTYTMGLSPVVVCPLSWSTFAIALTMGAAFNKNDFSLNTRLIFNLAIPVSK
ncbi:MAG TPA: hypothetical protein VD884_00325 [Ohtaekwangia sp.]|nr:hypothetical protein [Ohtaekwangia sp.]